MLAPRSATSAAYTSNRNAAAALALAVVVGGEEGQVMARRIVRCEIRRDEQDAGCRGEQRGQGCAAGGGGLLLWLDGRIRVARAHDARDQQRFVLEVKACGDEQLGEVLGAKGAVTDGAREAPPEGGAGELEGQESACRSFGEGVVHSAAEARPEVSRVGGGGVGQRWGRIGGKNLDKVGSGVIGKVDVSRKWLEEEILRRVCDDEDGGDGGDLSS